MAPETAPSNKPDPVTVTAAAFPRCLDCGMLLVAYYRTIPDGRTTVGGRCPSCGKIVQPAPDPREAPSA